MWCLFPLGPDTLRSFTIYAETFVFGLYKNMFKFSFHIKLQYRMWILSHCPEMHTSESLYCVTFFSLHLTWNDLEDSIFTGPSLASNGLTQQKRIVDSGLCFTEVHIIGVYCIIGLFLYGKYATRVGKICRLNAGCNFCLNVQY